MKSTVCMKASSGSFSCARKKFREQTRIGFTQTYVLSIILLVILGIYYVWSLNANANSGYALSEINKQHEELKDRTNILQTRIGDLSSIRKMQEVDDDMVPATSSQVDYIYLENLDVVFNNADASST